MAVFIITAMITLLAPYIAVLAVIAVVLLVLFGKDKKEDPRE